MQPGPVALAHLRRDWKATPGKQADRLVVQARRLQLAPELGLDRGRVAMYREHARLLLPEHELEQAVLVRLQPGCRPQLVAKRQVIGRGKRRQNVPRLDELLLDARYPRQHLERGLQVVRDDPLPRRAQLVHHQLEPQLGRLVDHDEQQLVVAVGHRPLAVEQLIQRQVAAVSQLAGEVGLDPRLEATLGVVAHVTAARCLNAG
jgi:hypothetical protein